MKNPTRTILILTILAMAGLMIGCTAKEATLRPFSLEGLVCPPKPMCFPADSRVVCPDGWSPCGSKPEDPGAVIPLPEAAFLKMLDVRRDEPEGAVVHRTVTRTFEVPED